MISAYSAASRIRESLYNFDTAMRRKDLRQLTIMFLIVIFIIFLISLSTLDKTYNRRRLQKQEKFIQEFEEDIPKKPKKVWPFFSSKWEKENLRLWPDDANCSSHMVEFGSEIPPAFLVTYPRSGSYWARYLLEATSGIFTGSVYNSMEDFEAGFLGELLPDQYTIVTKAHLRSHVKNNRIDERKDALKPRYPVILLIRNPAISIPSFFDYKMTGVENVDELPIGGYNSTEFHDFLSYEIPIWETTYIDRLAWTERILPIVYDEMRNDPIATVLKMLAFLGIKIPSADKINCLKKNIGAIKEEYPEADVSIFSTDELIRLGQAVSKVNHFLEMRSLPPMTFPKLPSFTVSGSKARPADLLLSEEKRRQVRASRIHAKQQNRRTL